MIPEINHPLQAQYRLTVNGEDITSKVNSRLVRLTLTDNSGEEADSLSLTLSDHDGKLELPPHNATITVALGKAGETPVDKGSYVVDETGHNGPPDQVEIVARSADFRPTVLQGKRSRSWHKTTLGRIIKEIATENMVLIAISSTLDAIRIGVIHQTAESDYNFLLRLAKKYDAYFNVKQGKLIFLKQDGTNTAGEPLPTVTIKREETSSHSYRHADKNAYTGVRARWNNISGAKVQYVLAGEGGNTTELQCTYANEEDAKAAAEAELAQLQRGKAELQLQLARPNLAMIAGQPLEANGFKPQIDGEKWVIRRVEHALDDSGGLLTRCEAEVMQASVPVEGEGEEGVEEEND